MTGQISFFQTDPKPTPELERPASPLPAARMDWKDKANPSVLEVLSGAHFSGNLILEMDQTDRGTYELLADLLESRMRGKWSKSKPRGHHFPYNPKPIIERVLETGMMPPRNPLALFETEEPIVQIMIQAAKDAGTWNSPETRILEPSAGSGRIARALRTAFPLAQIVTVELDPINAQVLRDQGFAVHETNFLKWRDLNPEPFDLVVMNPPFSGAGGSFLAHVSRALNMARAVIALGPHAAINDDKFLAWFIQHGTLYEDLGKGQFKDTQTHTVIFEATKNSGQWRNQRHQGWRSYSAWYTWATVSNEPKTDAMLQQMAYEYQIGNLSFDLSGMFMPKELESLRSFFLSHERKARADWSPCKLDPADLEELLQQVATEVIERSQYDCSPPPTKEPEPVAFHDYESSLKKITGLLAENMATMDKIFDSLGGRPGERKNSLLTQ